MHCKIFSLSLFLVANVLVVAQDDIEPICPGPCSFGAFDEDRLISDCTAQCNTTFGDPDAALECVNACSDWQNSISCTASPLVNRRSLINTGRRRRNPSEATFVQTHPRSDTEDHSVLVDHSFEGNSNLTLERRDMSSCLRSCYSSAHVLSICPGNVAAFMSQAAV
jgi:hypothetical protein